MSLHKAGTWLSCNIWLSSTKIFGFIKELYAMSYWLTTGFPAIADLPRDFLKPRSSWKWNNKKSQKALCCVAFTGGGGKHLWNVWRFKASGPERLPVEDAKWYIYTLIKIIDANNHIMFRGTSLLKPNKGMPLGIIITRKPHDELWWRKKIMLIGREVG